MPPCGLAEVDALQLKIVLNAVLAHLSRRGEELRSFGN